MVGVGLEHRDLCLQGLLGWRKEREHRDNCLQGLLGLDGGRIGSVVKGVGGVEQVLVGALPYCHALHVQVGRVGQVGVSGGVAIPRAQGEEDESVVNLQMGQGG